MKTSIKSIFAIAITTVLLSTTGIAAKASAHNNSYTNLNTVKNISKIKISGNVKLILVQDAKESIQVYDNYYAKNALVQQQNGELRISSFNKEPLTVIAHVNNISSIEAANTSSVKTAGNFNLLNLEVVLNDQSSADIQANTVSLNTSLNGTSNLNISGSTENYKAVLASSAKVGMNDFTATDSQVSVKAIAANLAQVKPDEITIEQLDLII